MILNIDSGIVLENFDSSWKRNNKGQIPTAVVSSHAPLQEQKSRKGVRELLPLLHALLLPLLQNPFTVMELRKKLYQKFQEPKQSEVLLKGIWNLGRQRNRALICVRNISSQVQISPDLSLSQLQRRIHQFIVISNLVILTARRDSLTIFSGRRGWVLGVCQRLKER